MICMTVYNFNFVFSRKVAFIPFNLIVWQCNFFEQGDYTVNNGGILNFAIKVRRAKWHIINLQEHRKLNLYKLSTYIFYHKGCSGLGAFVRKIKIDTVVRDQN